MPETRILCMLVLLAGTAAADIEETTEALDHRLIEMGLAAQEGDAAGVARHLADPFDAETWPVEQTARTPRTRFVETHGWVPTGVARPAPAADWAKDLLAFLGRHGAVEDVRFKPKGSRMVDGRLEATLKFHVIGGGVWTRGRAMVRCDAEGRIATFRLESIETDRALRPLFREHGAAVGLRGTDPAVLDHPTLGLAAYGAAVADVDGDGDLDLFSPGHDENVLYRNEGDGTFARETVALPRQGTGPLFLDYDNDGDPDLFCSANGEQMLLRNDGTGAFTDVSEEAGVAVASIGFSAVAGDVNGDGRPDIYVACYNDYGPVAPGNWDDARNGLPNLLFVSTKEGGYREAAKDWGVDDARWSYGAHFVDIDEDGKLDLYVANDFGAGNALYMNRGGRFEDVAAKAGVRDDGYAMGVSVGDFDNDGHLDLHVTRMSSTAGNRILDRAPGLAAHARLRHLACGNGLYRNKGDGTFEDVTATAGPFSAGWAWGGGFFDFDNDGFEDLYTPNGHMSGAAMKDT